MAACRHYPEEIMSLEPPVIDGRMPQIVKGKVLDSSCFASGFKISLIDALARFYSGVKYSHSGQSSRHLLEHRHQFPIQRNKPPLVCLRILGTELYESFLQVNLAPCQTQYFSMSHPAMIGEPDNRLEVSRGVDKKATVLFRG
jgi:hypothetical protein